jgi:hypothetical protein
MKMQHSSTLSMSTFAMALAFSLSACGPTPCKRLYSDCPIDEQCNNEGFCAPRPPPGQDTGTQVPIITTGGGGDEGEGDVGGTSGSACDVETVTDPGEYVVVTAREEQSICFRENRFVGALSWPVSERQGFEFIVLNNSDRRYTLDIDNHDCGFSFNIFCTNSGDVGGTVDPGIHTVFVSSPVPGETLHIQFNGRRGGT